MKKQIYLDFAAATPMSTKVLQATEPFWTTNFYNPSAEYSPGRMVRDSLQRARELVAHEIGTKPTEVVFTSGGTEANNLAIRGVMESFPGKKLLISAIEHDSVRKPAEQYNYTEIAVQKTGIINVDDITGAVDDETVLISVMYANNEIGTIQPIHKIALQLETIRKDRSSRGIKVPLYLHTDAAQAGNYLDLHLHRLGVDLISLNGGKLYGPKQSGVLIVRTGVQIEPMIVGGGQERGMRSGTENVSGAVGFAVALADAQSIKELETKRLRALQQFLIEELMTIDANIAINGSLKHRLPNNLSVMFPDTNNERFQIELDQRSIYVAVGSACSASHNEPSHVLGALGIDEAAIRSTLRITFGRQTNKQELKTVIKAFKELL